MCERSRAISPCHMNLHTQDHKSDGTRWIMIFDVPSASLLLLVKVVSCEMLCKLKISRVWFVFVLFVVLAVCCVCIAVAVMIWCWCAVDSLRRYEIDLPRCVASNTACHCLLPRRSYIVLTMRWSLTILTRCLTIVLSRYLSWIWICSATCSFARCTRGYSSRGLSDIMLTFIFHLLVSSLISFTGSKNKTLISRGRGGSDSNGISLHSNQLFHLVDLELSQQSIAREPCNN